MKAFYNDHDENACGWLKELVRDGHLPEGKVDGRPIQEVRPADLAGFRRCHFFAGIGGWEYALRLAGWPADRPVWTGSCPCQPFSEAGKKKGFKDDRHLWPEFYRLIDECRPATIFGEQVASRLGLEWLSGVFADLEVAGYAVAGANLPAACVGSPHIRQRLFWAATRAICESNGDGRAAWKPSSEANGYRSSAESDGGASDSSDTGQFAPREPRSGVGPEAGATTPVRGQQENGETGGCGCPSDNCSCHTDRSGRQMRVGVSGVPEAAMGTDAGETTVSAGADSGFPWREFDIIHYRDGKARRVEPGTFPLAHGVPGRVGLLRGYGNAIVPQVAAAFVEAVMGCHSGSNVR